MKVLITGINGRIGKYVAKGILSCGAEVFGLDREDAIDIGLESCKYIQADITHMENLEHTLSGYKFDTIIHLAALAHFTSNNISLEEFMKINCEGALNVAKVTYMCGSKKFLFSSTVDVYGRVENKVVDEETRCDPVTYYGKSKFNAEIKLKEYLESVGIEYYIFRFTPVYTPEYTKDLDKRVLLPKGIVAFYFNDGSYIFSLCSINNIVQAVVALAEGKINPGTYIISDQDTISAKEMAFLKKRKGEAKIVIRMPYNFMYTVVKAVSWVLEIFGKIEKGLLINNLNKIAKPIIYNSSKITREVELKWNVKNT